MGLDKHPTPQPSHTAPWLKPDQVSAARLAVLTQSPELNLEITLSPALPLAGWGPESHPSHAEIEPQAKISKCPQTPSTHSSSTKTGPDEHPEIHHPCARAKPQLDWVSTLNPALTMQWSSHNLLGEYLEP